MTLPVPIPKRMEHLKLDSRGYPIPYFTKIINGVPDFRYQDQFKQQVCGHHHLCSICGKKLVRKAHWFIAGPLGLQNRVHSDAPMHEECARFSILACPHLAFLKAERRSELGGDPNQLRTKPEYLYIVKADHVTYDDQYFYFRPVFTERFNYADNKLFSTGVTWSKL